MLVRKIKSSRALNTRGLLTSKKAIGQAMFKSALERDYLILLDFDHTVRRFEVQPIMIDMSHVPGQHRHYIPDVLIEFEQGYGSPWLVEIKREEDLRRGWAHLKPKFRAAMRICRQHGWVFHLITERHVRTPFLENVKFLRDYRHCPTDARFTERLITVASTPVRIKALQSNLAINPAVALATIWHHLCTGHLIADLDRPIDMNTEVCWHVSS